ARFVPYSAVISGHHSEGVVARRKIAVESLPARADVLPVAVPAFQFVAEQYLFRCDQTERGVVDLQVAHQCGQGHVSIFVRAHRVALMICNDLLNVYRRRKFVERQMARIDNADSIHGCEPQFSIRRSGDLWSVTMRNRSASYSIEYVENCDLDLLLRIF